jgi:hypothetical protein
MSRIPFDPYDFFGYLSSGLLVVVGMDLVFGFPHVLGQDLKAVDAAVLVLAVYVAGQLVAAPAKAILEDGVIDKVLGRPTQNLLRTKKPWIRWLLFPGYYKPLPAEIRARILKKAEAEGIRDTGEALFLHLRYHPQIVDDEKLMAKLDAFINKYGFARNLAFTSLLVGTSLLLKAWLSSESVNSNYAVTAFVGGVLLFYRYLKFFRQYAYEILNTYGSMK